MASLDAESGVMDVSDAYKLYITLSIFTALTAITTSLRLGTRLRFLGGWLVDDWFMVLAAVSQPLPSTTDQFSDSVQRPLMSLLRALTTLP